MEYLPLIYITAAIAHTHRGTRGRYPRRHLHRCFARMDVAGLRLDAESLRSRGRCGVHHRRGDHCRCTEVTRITSRTGAGEHSCIASKGTHAERVRPAEYSRKHSRCIRIAARPVTTGRVCGLLPESDADLAAAGPVAGRTLTCVANRNDYHRHLRAGRPLCAFRVSQPEVLRPRPS